MSKEKPWQQKLDAHGRLQLEDGLPSAGIEVTVRLGTTDKTAVEQVQQTGLQMHGQIGEIIVGHVATAEDLQNIVQLSCVQEVQLSRPLYEDDARRSGEDGSNA